VRSLTRRNSGQADYAGVAAESVRWLAPLLGIIAAVLLAQYAVAHPDLLHLDVSLGPAALLGGIVALLLCAGILVYPGFALAFLVAAIYLHLSQVFVRQGLPSMLQLVAVPLALAAVLHVPQGTWSRLARQPLTWLLVAYTLVLFASTTYARDATLADEHVAESAKALLIYLLIVLLASSARRMHLAAWSMFVAGALLATLGILRVMGVGVPWLNSCTLSNACSVKNTLSSPSAIFNLCRMYDFVSLGSNGSRW